MLAAVSPSPAGITAPAKNETSVGHQQQLAAGLPDVVIGQNISDLSRPSSGFLRPVRYAAAACPAVDPPSAFAVSELMKPLLYEETRAGPLRHRVQACRQRHHHRNGN